MNVYFIHVVPVVVHNNRWVKGCPLYCYLWVHICFNSISYIYNIILEFGSESNNCMTSIVTIIMYVMLRYIELQIVSY